jgi:hypothetical protein
MSDAAAQGSALVEGYEGRTRPRENLDLVRHVRWRGTDMVRDRLAGDFQQKLALG